MASEFDGRARMAAAKLICWFYGLKEDPYIIASLLYKEENQWYLSGQDIYIASKKDAEGCRWMKEESEDIFVWISDDECAFYTFVDPEGSTKYFGHGITEKDKGYNGKYTIDGIDLKRFSYYDENNSLVIDYGIIDIFTKKTWRKTMEISSQIIKNIDKWERLELIRKQIEMKSGECSLSHHKSGGFYRNFT